MNQTPEHYRQYRVISKFFQPIKDKPEFDQTLYWVFEVYFEHGKMTGISPSPRLWRYESREELEQEFKFIYDRLKDKDNTTILEKDMPDRYKQSKFNDFRVKIDDQDYEKFAEQMSKKFWKPEIKEEVEKDLTDRIQNYFISQI